MPTNTVILITGGSSGIGMTTALLFAEKGADIVITYRNNKQGADDVVDKITNKGRKTLAVQADLMNESDAKKVVDETMKMFGRIDVLVNNAGGYIEGDEWDGDPAIWIQSLQQNLVSVMMMSKYVTKVFQKQGHGIIVNVASVHAVSGRFDAISYGAAKAGVVNVTQSYATLLSEFGGRANSVSPSATNVGYWLTASNEELTEQLTQSPLIEPQMIAEKIMFLASDEAKGINGQNFVIE